MASCKQCGKQVGCSCELINGYCKSCWDFIQKAKNNLAKYVTNHKK